MRKFGIMKTQEVNEQVVVTALGFRKGVVAYPKRIEYKGMSYNFIDAGLLCLIKSGNRMARVITLSDGNADYKLRSDDKSNVWTLLSIAARV